jgi:periplasmic divalent cation tolerance protein
MKDIVLLYVTCKNTEEARQIAKDLVKSKIAACANIIPVIESIYEWDGALQQDAETLLLVKTTAERSEDCQARIKNIHSYTTPCILELDIGSGNNDYIEWLTRQTLPGAPSS